MAIDKIKFILYNWNILGRGIAMIFSKNENIEKFLKKNSLEELYSKYPEILDIIYNSLNGNFNDSVVNVSIRQNFIIMDLLNKINSNLEKIVNKK